MWNLYYIIWEYLDADTEYWYEVSAESAKEAAVSVIWDKACTENISIESVRGRIESAKDTKRVEEPILENANRFLDGSIVITTIKVR